MNIIILPEFKESENEFQILPAFVAKNAVCNYPKKLNIISVERTEYVDLNLCKNHLHLKIDDINDNDIKYWDKELKKKNQIYPEKQHILDAIEFDKKCNHKIHIIHCHAGISRSPAIGYAILRGRGMNKEDAMNKIMEIAEYSSPNERIVRLTDEILEGKPIGELGLPAK
jgi:predicted protein tyrosine phosphatase